MTFRRLLTALVALTCVLFGVQASASSARIVPATGNELTGLATTPAPTTCDAQPLSAALAGTSSICLRDLTVLAVKDQQLGGPGAADYDRKSLATVTDGQLRRQVNNANWWKLGALEAGQQVTLWASVDAQGVLQMVRWVEAAHLGPTVTVAAIAQGLVPENTHVWTTGIVYAPLTQEVQGDGDTHLQMLSPCGPGGITAETTPALRGFVDQPLQGHVPPAGSVQGTQDDPPADVPITVFGATRFDYGHGWWEVHPVRALHLATPAELAAAGLPCAQSAPVLNPSTSLVYGAPGCGDLPGQPVCGRRCFVSETAVGREPVVTGRCGESWQSRGPLTANQVNGAALLRGVSGAPGE